LSAGERLATLAGPTAVLGIKPQHKPKTVYNLEVQGQHVFRVTSNGLLVHNSCGPNNSGWRTAADAADELADAPFAPGSVGAAKVWTSIRSRLKAAELPTSGRIRFVPPKNYNPASPLTRGPGNGYIDRFGNEWVRGPSRTAGEAFEWDVQLSKRGREMLGWLSREGNHVNVSLGGHVTH